MIKVKVGKALDGAGEARGAHDDARDREQEMKSGERRPDVALTSYTTSLYHGPSYSPSFQTYTNGVRRTRSGCSAASEPSRRKVVMSLRRSAGLEAKEAQLAPCGAEWVSTNVARRRGGSIRDLESARCPAGNRCSSQGRTYRPWAREGRRVHILGQVPRDDGHAQTAVGQLVGDGQSQHCGRQRTRSIGRTSSRTTSDPAMKPRSPPEPRTTQSYADVYGGMMLFAAMGAEERFREQVAAADGSRPGNRLNGAIHSNEWIHGP
jgi:hypothetical protein